MGIKISPSFSQSVMDSLFGLDGNIEVFMDDISIFTNGSFKQHLVDLHKVLLVLSNENLRVNKAKCTFTTSSVNYLGHTITTKGIKPQLQKISTILKLEAPTNVKQLRSFIGLVNYYRDFIPQRSHVLDPLTSLTSPKIQFNWSTSCQAAFKKLQLALATSTLLAFPNPRLPFIIEPDASDFQLGSIISQHTSLSSLNTIIKIFLETSTSTIPIGFRPITFFSRKLSSAQRNYTTLEKELLSIVETCNKIFVFTDHRNLTFNRLSSQRALRWRLLAEEFNITIFFRPGASNLATDAISRLPLRHTEEPLAIKKLEIKFYDSYFNLPIHTIISPNFSLHFSTIRQHQQNDTSLQHLPTSSPSQFKFTSINDTQLLHYRRNESEQWKIFIPTSLIPMTIEYYHRILHHPGSTKLHSAISKHFYFRSMRDTINRFVKSCDICQRVKGPFPRLGHLPVKQAEVNPWDEVQIDLVGPWTFQIPPKWSVSVLVLTSIDPFSGLCDACRLENKTSSHVANKFYSLWLTRYPRPLRCIHDNGKEFTAPPFQHLLKHMGISNVTTTVNNPQANSVIERMHLSFGQILRAILAQAKLNNNEQHAETLNSYIDSALSSSLYAINCAVNSTTKVSPGAFIFQRDMLLPIQCITNWELIRHRKQLRI